MDKVCLKWGGFEKNIRESFKELRENQNHFDVTLATDDDQQIQAHKIILSAGSNFFSKILTKTKHPSPFLYLKGIKMSELERVVDFLYTGEANIVQEDLNTFLTTAEELQVKGLQNNGRPKIQKQGSDELDNKVDFVNSNSENGKIHHSKNTDGSFDSLEEPAVTTGNEELLIVQTKEEVEINAELDIQINQMMEKSEKVWKCKVCGKRSIKQEIKVHVETYIEGLEFSCQICNKTSATRGSLQSHISNYHSGTSFKCHICSKSWVTRNAFNKHNRVFHKQ